MPELGDFERQMSDAPRPLTQLADCDLRWIVRKLPECVRILLMNNPGKVFLAGGFIRACIARETVNDIDLFTTSGAEARAHANAIAKSPPPDVKIHRVVETDNAYSVIGRTPYPLQFISRWSFDDPAKCVESFDFTIARAAVWAVKAAANEEVRFMSCCDPDFYSDLAGKRLVYRCPVRNEDAGGSMLRVLKFYERGYRIPLDSLGAVMARMYEGVSQEAIEHAEIRTGATHEERTAFVLTGLLREVDPNTPLE